METKQEKLNKLNLFTKIVVLLAFVFISGFVAVAVWQAGDAVENMTIATASGTPRAWDAENNFAVAANSTVSTKLYNNQYLEFTVKVANADASGKAYVTNLANYLSTDGADADGFMKLSGESLEYTYTPDDAATWRTIAVLAPGTGHNAFRLDRELELAAAGGREDAVYFRFYTTLSDATTTSLSDKVSARLRNEAGDLGYVTATTTVAYQDLLKPTTVVATTSGDSSSSSTAAGSTSGSADPTDPNSAESAYVRPLGESSFVPDVATATETVASINPTNSSSLTTSIIILAAAVFTLSLALILYLSLRPTNPVKEIIR